jgi:hypothetical protein
VPWDGQTGVAPDAPVVVTLADADGISDGSVVIRVNGGIVAAVPSGSATLRTFTYTPLPFGYSENVTVTVDAADSLGAPMQTHTFSFTTMPASPTDVVPPYVASMSPGDGAADVPVNVTISVRVMDAASAIASTGLRLDYTPVSVVVHTNAPGDLLMTYRPSPDLQTNTIYTIRVDARDAAGNAMGTFAFGFRTGMEADRESPDAPAAFRILEDRGTEVLLTWSSVPDAVLYVLSCPELGNDWEIVVTGTSTTVPGLVADDGYEFRIRAEDSAGNRSSAATVVRGEPTPEGRRIPVSNGGGVVVPAGLSDLRIELRGLPADASEARLFEMAGRPVRTFDLTPVGDNSVLSLDSPAELAPGVYFVLVGEAAPAVYRLVIVR